MQLDEALIVRKEWSSGANHTGSKYASHDACRQQYDGAQ
jgi:hypothetical protein